MRQRAQVGWAAGTAWTAARRVLALACAAGGLLSAETASAQQVVLMSKGTVVVSDSAGGSVETEASISADGQWVVFVSEATDLISGQVDPSRSAPCDNGDVFLYDVANQKIQLISHTSGDTKTTADCGSFAPRISADGKFVAWVSAATDLVTSQVDGFNTADVFLYDVAGEKSLLVSHVVGEPEKAGEAPSGENSDHSINGNGQLVAFTSRAGDLVSPFVDLNGAPATDVFVFEPAKPTRLVSHSNAKPEETGNGAAENPAISFDGKFVAFQSLASNHAAPQDDSNGKMDVFLADITNTEIPITLVSYQFESPSAAASGSSDPSSDSPVISDDGRFVAYVSRASNIPSTKISDDTNQERPDVMLFERTLSPGQQNLLVSRKSGETVISADDESDAPSLSRDGKFVAFASLATDLASDIEDNTFRDVYLFELGTTTNTLVSHQKGDLTKGGDNNSGAPLIAFEGAVVAFISDSTNLVGETDGNGTSDLFLYDVALGGDNLLGSFVPSASQTGNGPSGDPFSFYPHSISADGKFVAFTSGATDLIAPPFVDGDGVTDVFVFDGSSNTMASIRATGVPFDGANNLSQVTDRPPTSVSVNGQWAAFVSYASNLVDGGVDTNGDSDVFLYDRLTDTTRLVSHAFTSDKGAGNFFSDQPVVSADGKHVVFRSRANNLIPPPGASDTNGATDVFLYDIGSAKVTLVSRKEGVGNDKVAANGASSDAVISRDQAIIAFSSSANDLIPGGDGNTFFDVYRHDIGANANTLISQPNTVPSANGDSKSPVISGNGTVIAFESAASTMVGTLFDTNGATDVFEWRLGGTPFPIRLVSRQNGTTEATTNGASGQPSISDDGAWITFVSTGRNIFSAQADGLGTPDAFLWNNNEAWLVSRTRNSIAEAAGNTGGVASDRPVLSANGNWISFQSSGSNLLCAQIDGNAAADVFLFDVTKKNSAPACPDDTTVANMLVSHLPGALKTAANGASTRPSISDSGLGVAFTSRASNLVTGQSDGAVDDDVFLYRQLDLKVVGSRRFGFATITGNDVSEHPVISGNGGYVAFDSNASDLIASDPNGFRDAFLFFAPFTDIQVTKDDGLTTALAGGSVTYVITVRNIGPADAAGVLVNDDFNDTGLGAQLASATWTCTVTGGATCGTASGSGDIVNQPVNLPAGSFVTYSVVATLLGIPASGDLINTACATPPASVLDTDPANDCATDTDTVAYSLDLSIAVVDVPDPVVVNNVVTYQVTVTNSGPSTSVEGTVVLTIPALDSGTVVFVPAGSSPECIKVGASSIVCGSANLYFVPGSPYVAVIQLQALGPAPDLITVTALVSGNSETGPQGPGTNNEAIEETTVVDGANFITVLTVTSKNGSNTLEWLTPGSEPDPYFSTKILRKAGSCPSGPTDGSAFLVTGYVQPLTNSKGLAEDTGLTNATTYCYGAWVDRDGGDTNFSAGKFAKGRPMNNAVAQPEQAVQWAFSTGATSVTAPTVGTGGILSVSNDRNLYSMNRGDAAATGSGLWPSTFWPIILQDIAQNRSPVVGIAISPSATQVTFIGSQDGSVYAIDASRGQKTFGDASPVWQSALLGGAGVKVQAAPAGIFAMFNSGLPDDFILAGSREPGAVQSNFYGLQVQNPGGGTVAWTYDGAGEAIGIVSGGAAVDYPSKRVYFGSRLLGSNSLWCIDLTLAPPSTCAGPGTWPKSFGDIDQSPVLRSGRLYIGNNNSQVIAINLATGASLPLFPLSDGPVKGFIFPDRLSADLYATTTNRVFGMTDAGPGLTNKAGWPAAGIASIPNPSIPLFGRLVSGVFVWVGSSNGRLYQIDTTNPALIKSVLVGGGGSVIGAPSLDVANEMVLVGSDQGVLYAIKVPLP